MCLGKAASPFGQSRKELELKLQPKTWRADVVKLDLKHVN